MEKERVAVSFMERMLPVLDSFELALAGSGDSEFAGGMRLICTQLNDALEGMGLRRIECVGKKFDPYLHEAVLISDSEKDGIVLEELQKGYTFGDFVVRHSKVMVSRKKQVDSINDNIKDNIKQGDE